MTDAFTTNDRRLSAADIGQIEDAEKLTVFFGGLGYDVADALRLDHAALGLDSEDLRHQIRSVQRVGADPVDGEVVVYLFELRSVTIALTQAIARRFRERLESPLLVLTKDYEVLDFVLVDRQIAPPSGRAVRAGTARQADRRRADLCVEPQPR